MSMAAEKEPLCVMRDLLKFGMDGVGILKGCFVFRQIPDCEYLLSVINDVVKHLYKNPGHVFIDLYPGNGLICRLVEEKFPGRVFGITYNTDSVDACPAMKPTGRCFNEIDYTSASSLDVVKMYGEILKRLKVDDCKNVVLGVYAPPYKRYPGSVSEISTSVHITAMLALGCRNMFGHLESCGDSTMATPLSLTSDALSDLFSSSSVCVSVEAPEQHITYYARHVVKITDASFSSVSAVLRKSCEDLYKTRPGTWPFKTPSAFVDEVEKALNLFAYFRACAMGDHALVAEIIHSGKIDIHATDNLGRNAGHYVVMRLPLTEKIFSKKYDTDESKIELFQGRALVVALLLKSGLSFTVKNINNNTATDLIERDIKDPLFKILKGVLTEKTSSAAVSGGDAPPSAPLPFQTASHLAAGGGTSAPRSTGGRSCAIL